MFTLKSTTLSWLVYAPNGALTDGSRWAMSSGLMAKKSAGKETVIWSLTLVFTSLVAAETITRASKRMSNLFINSRLKFTLFIHAQNSHMWRITDRRHRETGYSHRVGTTYPRQ